MSASAANDEPATKNPAAVADAKARKKRVVDLLQKRSKRENYTMGELVFLGNVGVDLQLTDAARHEYQRALQKADADPAARQGNERALTRVRKRN